MAEEKIILRVDGKEWEVVLDRDEMRRKKIVTKQKLNEIKWK